MTHLPVKTGPNTSAQVVMVWLIAVVLLVDLFLISLALVSLFQSRLQYTQRASVQAQNLGQALVYSMEGILETSDMALLSVVDEAERMLAQGPIEARSLNALIALQHARLPDLDSIRMANPQGRIMNGTGVAHAMAASIADRDYFLKLRDEPSGDLVLSKPLLGRISGKWVLIAARRVNNPDGSFGGVVYGAIALKRIQHMLSSMDVGRHGRISLRDGQLGSIVRHPESRGGAGSDIGRTPGSPEMLRRLAAGERSGTFYTPTSSDKTARLVSYRKIAAIPLYISVGLSPDDYLAPWRRELARMSVLIGLFIMVTVVLSRLVFLRWRREKGDRDALSLAKDELELRVAERTTELFSANRQLLTELAERKRAEESLRQGRNMLAQIIDSIPQSVFWKDRDSVYQGCNSVFARAAGMASPEDIAGKTDYALPWPARESRAYRLADLEVVESNIPKYHIIEQLQQADGIRIWLDTTKIPLCDGEGAVYGVLGVYENITERKAVEESRNKALAFIESLLASLPAGILVYDGESGECLLANSSVAELVGGTIAELRAQNFRKLDSWRAAGIDLIAE